MFGLQTLVARYGSQKRTRQARDDCRARPSGWVMPDGAKKIAPTIFARFRPLRATEVSSYDCAAKRVEEEFDFVEQSGESAHALSPSFGHIGSML